MIELQGGQLYQWDVGRFVTIKNATVAYFCNKGDSKAVKIKLEADDDSYRIPDRYLATGKPLYVYVASEYVNGSDIRSETKEARIFPVVGRAKPVDYVPTAAENAYGKVCELTESAKDAAKDAEDAKQEAYQYSQAAAASAAAADIAKQDAQAAADEANSHAATMRPLVVKFDPYDNQSYFSANEIYAEFSSGRDVLLQIYQNESPIGKDIPIATANAKLAVFVDVGTEYIEIYTIDSTGDGGTKKVPLTDIAYIKDDVAATGKHTWSSQKILEMIAQGGTGDINMGGRQLSLKRLKFTAENGGASLAYDEKNGTDDWGSECRVLVISDSTIIRNVAPGRLPHEAVNKAQLSILENNIEQLRRNAVAIIDNRVEPESVWSSHNTVDKLCPKVNENSLCVQMQPVGGSRVKVSAKKDSDYPYIKLYCTGKNLYPQDEDAFENNYYVNRETGDLTPTDSSIASYFLPVSHLVGKTLAISGAYVGGSRPGFMFYDSNKVWMGKQNGGNTATAVVPEGAAYFRFTIRKSNITVFDKETNKNVLDYSLIQLEIGNAVTEVEAYRENPIDPADDDVDLDWVFLDGVNTFYAYAGTMDGDTFVPAKAVDVHVEGYNHPEYEIEKQRKEIDQLRSAIVSLGGNI